GPKVDNAGSYARIEDNTITGIGPTMVIAQNGIQISRGATADVRDNNVSDHAYVIPLNLPEFTAAGILLYQPGRVLVDSNNLHRNQDGVDLITMPGTGTVSNNTVIG